MKSRLVARPDNMSGNSSADGPQDSQIVVPGDNLGQSGRFEAGHGVLIKNDTLLATKNGKLMVKDNVLTIEPLHTTYMPRPSDLVIGFVEGCTNNIWFIDIGAPFNAILPMSIGEAILCRVQEVEETHSSVVTMKGMGLRKIVTGSVDEIDPHFVSYLSKNDKNLLREIKEESDCRIITTDNGRIWIDGDVSGIIKARNKLNILSNNHRVLNDGGNV